MRTRLERDTKLEFRYLSTPSIYDKSAMLWPIAGYKWLEKKLKKDTDRRQIYAR